MNIRRGGIYIAALDPVVGREISKTRPVLVVSNDKANEFSGTVTVLPITSKSVKRAYPFEVILRKGTADLPKDSKVKADQIRTLDKSRLLRFIGFVGTSDMLSIDKAIKIHLSL